MALLRTASGRSQSELETGLTVLKVVVTRARRSRERPQAPSTLD